MYTATLRCGTVLSYEARSFRPDPGDVVPCRRHGYCAVDVTGGSASGGPFPARARPRAQGDLLDWLRDRSETTVHVLRRQGFTLRMIVAAERDGLVDLDLDAGWVGVRPGVGEAQTRGAGTAILGEASGSLTRHSRRRSEPSDPAGVSSDRTPHTSSPRHGFAEKS
jgi:hypothetical protein